MQIEAPEAFDIDSEPQAVQRLYGLDERHTEAFGKQCLLARRLVERGVRFVQLHGEATGTTTPASARSCPSAAPGWTGRWRAC